MFSCFLLERPLAFFGVAEAYLVSSDSLTGTKGPCRKTKQNSSESTHRNLRDCHHLPPQPWAQDMFCGWQWHFCPRLIRGQCAFRSSWGPCSPLRNLKYSLPAKDVLGAKQHSVFFFAKSTPSELNGATWASGHRSCQKGSRVSPGTVGYHVVSANKKAFCSCSKRENIVG